MRLIASARPHCYFRRKNRSNLMSQGTTMTIKSGVDTAQSSSETSAAPGVSASTEPTADAWPAAEVLEVIPTPRRLSAGARLRQRLQPAGALLADAAGDLKSRLSAIDFKQVKSVIPGFGGNPELPVDEDGAAANESTPGEAAAEQPAPDAERSNGRLRELAVVSRSKLNSSLAQIAVGSAPIINKGQQVAERIAARLAIRADLAFLPKASKIKGAFRDVQGFVQRIVIDEPLAAGAQAAAWVDSHDPKGRFAAVTTRMTAWNEERAGDVPADEPVTDAATAPTVEVAPRRRSRATKPTDALKPSARKPAARKPAVKEPAAKEPAAKEPAVKKPAAKKPAARKPAAKKLRSAPEVEPDAQVSAAENKAPAAGNKAKPAATPKKKPQIASAESVAESPTPVKRVRARTPGKATEARPGAAKRTKKPQSLSAEAAGESTTMASPADAQSIRATIED